jgi:hypothetical protein
MPASKLPVIVDGNPLLGTWKLKSHVVTTAAGVRSTPNGENPTGYLSCSGDGRMQVIGADVSSAQVVNTCMAKSVLDSGWGMLKTLLQYKGQQAGRIVQIASARDTSRSCSSCGSMSGPHGVNGLGAATVVSRTTAMLMRLKISSVAPSCRRPCTGMGYRPCRFHRAEHLARPRQGYEPLGRWPQHRACRRVQ